MATKMSALNYRNVKQKKCIPQPTKLTETITYPATSDIISKAKIDRSSEETRPQQLSHRSHPHVHAALLMIDVIACTLRSRKWLVFKQRPSGNGLTQRDGSY